MESVTLDISLITSTEDHLRQARWHTQERGLDDDKSRDTFWYVTSCFLVFKEE